MEAIEDGFRSGRIEAEDSAMGLMPDATRGSRLMPRDNIHGAGYELPRSWQSQRTTRAGAPRGRQRR